MGGEEPLKLHPHYLKSLTTNNYLDNPSYSVDNQNYPTRGGRSPKIRDVPRRRVFLYLGSMRKSLLKAGFSIISNLCRLKRARGTRRYPFKVLA